MPLFHKSKGRAKSRVEKRVKRDAKTISERDLDQEKSERIENNAEISEDKNRPSIKLKGKESKSIRLPDIGKSGGSLKEKEKGKNKKQEKKQKEKGNKLSSSKNGSTQSPKSLSSSENKQDTTPQPVDVSTSKPGTLVKTSKLAIKTSLDESQEVPSSSSKKPTVSKLPLINSSTMLGKTTTSPEQAEIVPIRMDKITLGHIIGKGNYGVVRIGLDQQTALPIAIKEISLEAATTEQRGEAFREVEILKKLSHPNIVRLLASFTTSTPSVLSIVTEYVPGGSLFDQLQAFRKFKESVASIYCLDLLEGIKHMHSLGIAHRDIKCANLLIEQSGKIKVADLGSAKMIPVGMHKGVSNVISEAQDVKASVLRGCIGVENILLVKREDVISYRRAGDVIVGDELLDKKGWTRVNSSTRGVSPMLRVEIAELEGMNNTFSFTCTPNHIVCACALDSTSGAGDKAVVSFENQTTLCYNYVLASDLVGHPFVGLRVSAFTISPIHDNNSEVDHTNEKTPLLTYLDILSQQQCNMNVKHKHFNSNKSLIPTLCQITESQVSEYVGFQLSEPNEFVLGDMTLTHNSPYWMSPESIKYEKYDAFKSDVWSIGATVYEMVTGKPPFFNFTQIEAAMHHIAKVDDPTPPMPKVSNDLKHFLRRCFVKDPKRRATLDELLSTPWIEEAKGFQRAMRKEYELREERIRLQELSRVVHLENVERARAREQRGGAQGQQIANERFDLIQTPSNPMSPCVKLDIAKVDNSVKTRDPTALGHMYDQITNRLTPRKPNPNRPDEAEPDQGGALLLLTDGSLADPISIIFPPDGATDEQRYRELFGDLGGIIM